MVNMVFGFDGTYGGHVPCGVTAHGSPGGPLQFDRLEAALAARFHRNAGPRPSVRHLDGKSHLCFVGFLAKAKGASDQNDKEGRQGNAISFFPSIAID
jgi:hypothetical protein